MGLFHHHNNCPNSLWHVNIKLGFYNNLGRHVFIVQFFLFLELGSSSLCISMMRRLSFISLRFSGSFSLSILIDSCLLWVGVGGQLLLSIMKEFLFDFGESSKLQCSCGAKHCFTAAVWQTQIRTCMKGNRLGYWLGSPAC